MIIGISGKINSGKDTIGEIIQYLTTDWKEAGLEKPSFEEYKEKYHGRLFYNPWQNKKFADKLKNIVCLLIGCTREQLEDREFKEKELGEEWSIYIHDNGNVISQEVFLSKSVNAQTYYSKHYLTPRKLLQLLGTECGRNIIHPNIWVNALMSEYQLRLFTDKEVNNDGITVTSKEFPKWIITDMRFPNELAAVKDKGGITIRVNRGDFKNKTHLLNEHESETALDNSEFEHVIYNDGTLEELVGKVESILTDKRL